MKMNQKIEPIRHLEEESMATFHRPQNSDFVIVSGRGNPDLVKHIAAHLEVEPLFLETTNWGNGYPRCTRRPEDQGRTLAGKKAIIVTSLQYRGTGSPIEELEMMIDACGSADEVHVILTWLCGKDDISHTAHAVPNLTLICNRLRQLGINSINWYDPHHAGQIELLYPIHRRRRLYFLRDLIEVARELGIEQIGAADFGSIRRARKVKELLGNGNPIINVEKDHDHIGADSPLSHCQASGSKCGESIGFFDDMALSLKTLKGALESAVVGLGFSRTFAFAAHFDPAPQAFANLTEMFEKGWLTQFVTTNSIPIDPQFLTIPGFRVVDISQRVANLITLIVDRDPTSTEFDDV